MNKPRPSLGVRYAASAKAPHGARVGDTVEMHGVRATVVSKRDAEKADAVGCAPATIPLYYADNVTCPCAHCGVLLQHRPHMPMRPPKLCLDCLNVLALGAEMRHLKAGRGGESDDAR